MISHTMLDRLDVAFVQFRHPTTLNDDFIYLDQMRLEVGEELFATIQTKQNNGHIEKGSQMHDQIVAQAAHAVAIGQKG